jgi:hypothetical protein
MSKTDKYFQFPIGALHFGKSIDKVDQEEMTARLHLIISYCIVNVGTSIVDSENEEMIEAMAIRSAYRMDFDSADLDDRETRILLCGAEQLNVRLGQLNYENESRKYDEICRFATYGNQQVRLRSDLAWEAIAGGSWTWRSLATLCAIYAAIGTWQKTKLTYDRIGAMSLGFNGQRNRDKHRAKKHQLTDKQTLRTVAALRERGFFVSASPNKRHVFYSHKMTLDELIEELASTAKPKISASSITERIKQRQAELAVKQ